MNNNEGNDRPDPRKREAITNAIISKLVRFGDQDLRSPDYFSPSYTLTGKQRGHDRKPTNEELVHRQKAKTQLPVAKSASNFEVKDSPPISKAGSFDDRLPFAKKISIDSDSSSSSEDTSYNNYFNISGGGQPSTFARRPRKSSSFYVKEQSRSISSSCEETHQFDYDVRVLEQNSSE